LFVIQFLVSATITVFLTKNTQLTMVNLTFAKKIDIFAQCWK